ncbi:MAG: hypothetical protein CMP21_05695 [Rickettsiales bacterium]|nr:hypothetical protein [Rickettsiales bacterium]|tara:strand:+ start:273 stop:632 length:360 start_codon:yes stop_codon:yes gene_type:complete
MTVQEARALGARSLTLGFSREKSLAPALKRASSAPAELAPAPVEPDQESELGKRAYFVMWGSIASCVAFTTYYGWLFSTHTKEELRKDHDNAPYKVYGPASLIVALWGSTSLYISKQQA